MTIDQLPTFPLFVALLSLPWSAWSHKGLEAQLYEDLLYDYNKIPRPVKNSTDVLVVDVGASLIRIIDVDEKNQVLTTNLWLEMKWTDAKLQWDPEKYGAIKTLHIPSDMIWTPDLVLYNNAAGDPDITIFTDALVSYEGRVSWQPPAIYKSFCSIDVTWFPYDIQNCTMKFGAWSYTGYYVDLRQLPREEVTIKKDEDGSDIEFMENGMDLSFFYKSVEWDLLELKSARHSVLYASCCGPEKYVDITYYFVLRRKTLFFTCNLIIPCFLISLLTTFVFYLSDHKITFSISILVTLTVFFLVLIDIMPPTSLVVPMFGRYLITTMILVALSTMVSVVTVNFRFRSGAAHQMSPWIRTVFLNFLPRLLRMQRPRRPPLREAYKTSRVETSALVTPALVIRCPVEGTELSSRKEKAAKFAQVKKPKSPSYYRYPTPTSFESEGNATWKSANDVKAPVSTEKSRGNIFAEQTMHGEPENDRQHRPVNRSNTVPRPPKSSEVQAETMKAKKKINDIIFANLLRQVKFIAEYFRRNEEETEISDDWTFVAMVLDRLFLIIFSMLNVATFVILIKAPSLYDEREPLNVTVATKPLGQANLFKVK